MPSRTIKRRKRAKVQSSHKIKVFANDGSSWVEERCWRCGRVLSKHLYICGKTYTQKVSCPSCKAINIIELEE